MQSLTHWARLKWGVDLADPLSFASIKQDIEALGNPFEGTLNPKSVLRCIFRDGTQLVRRPPVFEETIRTLRTTYSTKIEPQFDEVVMEFFNGAGEIDKAVEA